MKALMEIRNLNIGHQDRTLFSGISFDICEGECIMLCGANGSGKTTLMKALGRKDDIVMIPTGIPKVKGFTLKEFIRTTCYAHSDMGGRLSPAQEAGLDMALCRLGIAELADRDISTLSDGEFQKAAIASALVRRVSVIMLDEPTAFLDAENRISVLRTLRSLTREATGPGGRKPAVIFSTHDLHDGLAVADKVIALGADGQVHVSTDDLPECVSSIFKGNDISIQVSSGKKFQK